MKPFSTGDEGHFSERARLKEVRRVPVTVVVTAMTDAEAPFLKEALSSVASQSVAVQEVILFIDQRNEWADSTITAIPSLASRLRVERRPRSPARVMRNEGVELAQGKWIAFLDGDDYWHREKIAQQLQHLESTKAEFSSCDFYFANERSQRYGIGKCIYPFPSFWLVMRSLLIEWPFFEGPSSEDADWLHFYLRHLRHVRLAKPLGYYRVRVSSYSTSGWKRDVYRRRKVYALRATKTPLVRGLVLGASYVRYLAHRESTFNALERQLSALPPAPSPKKPQLSEERAGATATV